MINLYRKSVFLALLSGFLFFSVNSAAQVSFSGGTAPTMCVGNPAYVALSDIVISESGPIDFTGIIGTDGTFSIEPTLASRFEFEPGFGSVLFEGEGDATVAASIIVTATTITVTLSETTNDNEAGVGLLNKITISGIRVRAINAAASLLLERVNPASTIIINGFSVGTDISTSSLVSNAPPSVAEAGPAQNVCGTLTTLSADAPVVGVGQWSFVSNPDALGAIGDINDRNSLFSGAAGSTYVLQWTVSNGVCAPSTDNISIHLDGIPTPANAGPSQQKCNNGSFTLAGNTPTIGSGSWSVVSGSAGITTPFSPTSGVTGVAPGSSAVLRWTIGNGVCAPSTSDVTLTNYLLPSTADAGLPSITQCNNSTFAMNATAPVIGSGIWSVVSGSAAITNANSPNTTITGIIAGNTATLRWTVSNGVCAFTQDDIILTNNATPTTAVAGAAQNQCNNSNFTLTGNIPVTGTGLWSVVSGTATITTPSSPTSGVTGVPVGSSAVLRWTISNGVVCTPSTSDVTLTNYQNPTPADAGLPSITQCNTSTFTMAATPAAIGTGTWTVVSGTATITNINSATTTITGITAGNTATLRWTTSNGVCAPTQDDIILTNNATPTTAVAGAAQNQCNNSNFTLTGNIPVTGTGLWSVVSGTATITTPSSPTSGVTGVPVGSSAVLRWTISNGVVCTPSTSDVTLTNYQNPTPADAGLPSITQCNTSTFTMAATPAAIGTGTWTVVSGTATITNINSATTTITGITAGNTATLRWTTSNGVCAPTQDDIILTNNATPTTAVAGAAQNQCNNSNFTLTGNIPVTGTGLWSVVSGTATITTPSSPTSGVTGVPVGSSAVLRWTISNGVVCTPSTSDVTLTNYQNPTPADAGLPSITQCNTSTFTMAATPAAIGTGTWTVVSGTATITNINSATTTITGITAGNTATLRWTTSNGVCAPTQDDIILTNNATPTTAVAGAAQNQCNNSNFTLTGNIPVTGTGLWSVVSGTATITTPSSPTSGVTGVPVGSSAVLRWTISNGVVCTPSTSDVTLTNYQNPTPADAGLPSITQCNTSTFTMAATPAAIGTGTWTVVSGTATITNINSATTTITGITAGNTATLRWTTSNGVCAPTQDDIILTNNATPTTAVAGAAQNQCNNSNFTLTGNIPVTGTGLWSVVSGTATITTPSSPTSGVTGVPVGSSAVLRWTISNGVVCTPSTSDVTLTNYQNPTPADAGLPSITQCNTSTFTMAATPAAIGTGTWTVVSGTATITNINSATTTITGITAGNTATLRWTTSNGVCAPTQDDIILTNNATPTTAVAGAAQNQCNNSNFTLTGNIPVTGTGLWSVVSGTATITTPSSPTSGVTGVPVGSSAVLRWTISNGVVCTPSTSDVTLTNYQNPTPADAGLPSITQCNTSTFTMAATPAAIGTGTWTVVSGTATITNINSATTTITGITAGNTATLRWTTSNGVCAPTQDDIILTNNATPTTAVAGAAQNQCNNSNFTLTGNIPVTGTGLWSVVSGTATITTPSSPTSGVTGVPVGSSAVLRWTISNGVVCTPSTSDVTLTNYQNPTPADAGLPSITQCNTSTFTMAATPAAIGTGTWTVVSGTATITNINSATTTITGITAGNTATLRWTTSNGVCAPTQDDIILTNNATPTTAVAGAAQNQCNNSNFTLTGNIPVTGTGLWSVVSGTATITTPSSPTSGVTGVPVGSSAVLRWTISNGVVCTPSTSDVTLTNYQNPTPADAGLPSITQCNTSTFTMAATPAAIGTGTWTVVSGTATITNINSATTTITGITAGNTATLRWTTSNGVCAPTQDDIILTNNATPTTAVAGAAQDQCNNSNFTLTGNIPVTGTGLWSVVSGTATITTPSSPTSGVTGVPVGSSAVLRWTISNGVVCTPSTSDVTLTNYQNPTPADAGLPSITQCNTSTFTMAATPAAIGTGTWTVVSGTATITNINSATTTITGITAGNTATLRWTTSNGVCAPTQDDIILTNNATPTTAVAGAAQNQCNNSNFTLTGNIPVTGTGLWSVVSGTATITTPSSPTSGVTGVPVGSSAVLRWTISNGVVCTPSTSDVTLTNYQNPTPADAGLPSITQCNTSTFTMAATPAAIGTGTWTVVSGTATITNINSATTTITGITAGNTATLRWTTSNGVCAPTQDDIILTNNATPTTAVAGAAQNQCNNSNFTLTGNIPVTGTGLWSVVSGTATITTPSSPTSGVTGVPVGSSAVLRWTISNGVVCTPSTSDVTLTNYQNPTPADAGLPSITQCNTSTFTMAATPAAIGTGTWTVVSGTATITNINSATTTITGITAGNTATLRWTTSNGVCAPTQDDIILTNNATPTTAVAGAAQDQCNNSNFTLTGNIPVTGTGLWSVVSGTATITTPSSPTSGVTGVPVGSSAVLRWTISNGVVCTPSTSDVTLTNYQNPTPADAGLPSITQCNTSTFTMAATPAAIGTGTWTVVSGTATITNINSATTTITGITAGNTATLRWTTSNGVCAPTQDDIILTNNATPTTAVAGAAQDQCNNSNFTLTGNIPVTGTGLWSVVSGTATITTPSSPTSGVTGVVAGTSVTLRWTISNGVVCTPSTSDVVLTNSLAPIVNAGSDASICEGAIFNFSSQSIPANAANYSSIQWLSVGTPPTGILYNATTLTPTYQPGANETGVLIFRLTANGSGVCTPVFDEMQITIVARPVVEAGDNAEVCQGTPTFNFATRSTIASAANGSRMWTTPNGNGSFVDATQLNPIYNVSPSDVGNTIVFILTITSGSPTVCSVVQDQFLLKVNKIATVTVPAPFSVCEPTSFDLTGTIADASSASWSLISGSGTLSVSSIAAGSIVTATYSPVYPAERNQVLHFRLTSNDPDGSGPCNVAFQDVAVTVDESPKVNAGLDDDDCEYNTVPLNGTVDGPVTTVGWTGGTIGQFGNPAQAVTTYTLTTAERDADNLIIEFTLTTNDPPGVCAAASDKVLINVVDRLDPVTEMTISGLAAIYAENQPPATMAGFPGGGVFSGDAVSGNQFFPNIANITPLINTVSYSVTDGFGCVSTRSQQVIVNPITDIDFTLDGDLGDLVTKKISICANTGLLPLVGNPPTNDPDSRAPTFFEFSDPSRLEVSGPNYFIDTDGLAPGSYFVTYTYTNSSPATSVLTKEVIVRPAPKAIIDNTNSCETETVFFTESSFVIDPTDPMTDTITGYFWDFDDNGNSSSSSTPDHDYSSGTYDVNLKVTTNLGCSDTTVKTIRIGPKPDVNFTWTAFCKGDRTKFTDATDAGISTIIQYAWVFGDGRNISGAAGTPISAGDSNAGQTTGTYTNPNHKYVDFGQRDVTLTVETNDGCINSVTRTVSILDQPTIAGGYMEDFESGQGSWFKTRSNDLIPSDTSWVFGVPTGSVINSTTSTNGWWTGQNSTVTDNSTYYNNEKSAVIGPCINLQDVKRPMISLDYWSDSELGSDGAVLQYSTDGGGSWLTIGNDADVGINWYNGRALTGNPGNQPLGQYGWTGQVAGNWKNARYSLEEIDKSLRDSVIFRIAFGSNNDNSATPTVFNGFAFDNVFIGEKKRNVLVEYFTNTSVSVFNSYFDDFYDDQMLLNDSADFFKIQYHTNRPIPDPINEQNKLSDPDDRASFYGITGMPSAVMDGIDGNYYGRNLDGLHLKITQEVLDRRALEDPLFDIIVSDTVPTTATSIHLRVKFKYISTAALNNPVTFQVALVEDSLIVGTEPMQRNVLRKLLLGSAGRTVSNTWTLNQTFVIDTVIQITVPIGANNDKLYLVAFVQERMFDSNVIYQSAVRKLGVKSQAILTGVDDPVLEQIKDIAIYPNPATRYINFATDASLTGDYQYTIVDQRGVTLLSGNLNRNLTIPQQVELSNLADGVYIVMIHQGNRRLIQRKLAVLKR
jgi:Na+-transporting NADH:ubiquinone oxidoreductase subunit NqrC